MDEDTWRKFYTQSGNFLRKKSLPSKYLQLSTNWQWRLQRLCRISFEIPLTKIRLVQETLKADSTEKWLLLNGILGSFWHLLYVRLIDRQWQCPAFEHCIDVGHVLSKLFLLASVSLYLQVSRIQDTIREVTSLAEPDRNVRECFVWGFLRDSCFHTKVIVIIKFYVS